MLNLVIGCFVSFVCLLSSFGISRAGSSFSGAPYFGLGVATGYVFMTKYSTYEHIVDAIASGSPNGNNLSVKASIGYGGLLNARIYLAFDGSFESYISANAFRDTELSGPNYSLDAFGTLDIVKGLSGFGFAATAKLGYLLFAIKRMNIIAYTMFGYTGVLHADRDYTQASQEASDVGYVINSVSEYTFVPAEDSMQVLSFKHGVEFGVGSSVQVNRLVGVFVEVSAPLFISSDLFIPSCKFAGGFGINF